MTTNGTYLYAGAETGGIYRLSPGAEQWQEPTHGLPPSPSVRAIAAG